MSSTGRTRGIDTDAQLPTASTSLTLKNLVPLKNLLLLLTRRRLGM